MFLQQDSRINTGDVTLDTGLCALDIVTLPSGSYLYATTAGQGGLVAFRLNADGTATEIDRQYFPTWMREVISGTARVLEIDDTLQVVIGGRGGGALMGYEIQSNGQLGTLQQSASLATGTNRVADVAEAESGSSGAVYVSDEATGQITAYLPSNGGTFAALPGEVDLGGPAELETVQIGSTEYLLASDLLNNGVVAYQVLASGGLQKNSEMGADQGLGIATPTAMEVVQAFGQTWVILAAAGSHALSTMRMTAGGQLEAADLVLDTLDTRFGGVQAMATVEIGDWVVLLAGGADDGLSLFTLLPDGRLVHLQSIEHQIGSGLMNVEALDMTVVGNEIQVFVTSASESGLTQFSIPIDTLGLAIHDSNGARSRINGSAGDDLLASEAGYDTLIGGAGNDILSAGADGAEMTGGAGADRFVISGEAGYARITDFTPGQDVLDLSDLPMLRSTAQLGLSSVSGGATLSYRGQIIVVRSSDGSRLDMGDIFGAGFSGPDRIQILPAPPGITVIDGAVSSLIEGTERNDTLSGNGGEDTLNGGAGNDDLSGGASRDALNGEDGDDALSGGGGEDNLVGGNGDDTIGGGAENDFLAGGAGFDELRGDGGNDEMWGADGSDSLWGGTGNDTLGGGGDADSLYGNDGNDHLGGGGGNDWMIGGNGDDSFGGFSGNDTLYGNDGNDGMWGGVGQDLGYGGAGNDTFGGQEGDDLFYGDIGDDLGNGGTGSDELFGQAGHDTLNGDAGRDSLWGNDGNDWLSGGSDSDTMGGGRGNDTLLGGDGWDEMWGADGNDVGWGGAGGDTLGGGNGNDTLRGEAQDDLVWGGNNEDLQYGGTGNDTVGGFQGHDRLYGEDGNDEVWGNVGNDLGYGGNGNDTMGGAAGNDTLYGDAGNDQIAGGTGDDVLWGGSGADTFVFYSPHGNDTIRDFDPGSDHIQLKGAGLSFNWLDIRAVGSDTLIVLPGGNLRLSNVAPGELDAGDFLFG